MKNVCRIMSKMTLLLTSGKIYENTVRQSRARKRDNIQGNNARKRYKKIVLRYVCFDIDNKMTFWLQTL